MVEVTETNRNPDIDAEVINAASVSADSGTVGTLEATTVNNKDLSTASSDDVVTVGASPPDIQTTADPTVNTITTSNGATIQNADLATDYVSAEIAASVADGNAGIVWVTTLADGETLNVTQAGLVNNDGSAVPSGCDLIIADLTNSVSETTLISGDGTVQDDQTGSPLGSYQNSSGGDEQVAVMVDNGNFNGGSGGVQNVIASFIGRVV